MWKNSRDSPALKPVVLIHSAAAEKVFSLLTNSFNERKELLTTTDYL